MRKKYTDAWYGIYFANEAERQRWIKKYIRKKENGAYGCVGLHDAINAARAIGCILTPYEPKEKKEEKNVKSKSVKKKG